jgi:hypothetical protein
MMELSGGGAAAEKVGGGDRMVSSATDGLAADDDLGVGAGESQPSGISMMGDNMVEVMGDGVGVMVG